MAQPTHYIGSLVMCMTSRLGHGCLDSTGDTDTVMLLWSQNWEFCPELHRILTSVNFMFYLPNIAIALQGSPIVIRCCLSVDVCLLLSVMRVYCDRTAEDRITQFPVKHLHVSTFHVISLTSKLYLRAQIRVLWFSIL